MLIFVIGLFAFFGLSADAQTLPDRYMVTDVAADDVLNIRAAPNAQAEIIGTFAPFTLNVEVLREENGWGYVGAGESSGWVSMRFLAPNPRPANALPRPMACFGTEPFWNVAVYPRGAEYSAMGEARRDLTILRERIGVNGFLIKTRESGDITRTLIIDALPCNDGMSDRDFGMSVRMYTDAPGASGVNTGCCTMQVN